MKRIHHFSAATLCVTCVAIAMPVGASAAPNLVGMTYEKASSTASNWGLTAVISTSTGTELQQSDCVVINQVLRPATTLGQNSKTLLLSLNCNATVATATEAGNSAATPEGQKAKKAQATKDWRENTPQGQAWCATNVVEHPEWDWTDMPGCPS